MKEKYKASDRISKYQLIKRLGELIALLIVGVGILALIAFAKVLWEFIF